MTRIRGFAIFYGMINRDDMDKLREYLKSNGVPDPYNSDWYSLNGLEISLDNDCVYVYLSRDRWLVACTKFGCDARIDNPHRILILDNDGLMRLIKGGEMAYNNMENERVLDEL